MLKLFNKTNIKTCSQCRAGEVSMPADYYVQGTIFVDTCTNPVPYKAYICQEHYELLVSDGANLKIKSFVYQ